jgi:uncharacterized membrane protein
MEPLSFLILVPFIISIMAIKNYKWVMDFYNRKITRSVNPTNPIELKAKIIASSLFIILWSIIGFILINH